MKLRGPLAVPPPVTCSALERSVLKLVPVPDPYLNSKASVRARSMIPSIESLTSLIKQAEHCGFL